MENTKNKPKLKNKAKYQLTVKQEKFCQEYVKIGNASEAYRIAYNTSGMLPATVNRRAKDLMDNGKIRARTEELIAPAAKKATLTVTSHLEELGRLKALAETAGITGNDDGGDADFDGGE